MTNSGLPTALTGGHGRDYPALTDDTRAELLRMFNHANREYFPGTMGYELVEARRGYARMRAESDKRLNNPIGIMHGGASFGLADTVVAAALRSIFTDNEALLTVEMKINYLEPIAAGEVVAEAYVLRSSRRSAYAEVDIWANGKLAARASTTYMIRPMPGSV